MTCFLPETTQWRHHTTFMSHEQSITLWEFKIAIENKPFLVDLPIQNGDLQEGNMVTVHTYHLRLASDLQHRTSCQWQTIPSHPISCPTSL